MKKGREIMPPARFKLTLRRLKEQLVEDFGDNEEICLIGIQPRGTILLQRIIELIGQEKVKFKILEGHLDITFYRDDFRRRERMLAPDYNKMDFLIEGRDVVLIDDVLYTGRTIQAALNALQHYGRPSKIKLMTLIDRRFNRHLPIQCDYAGMEVDAVDNAYVQVNWGMEDSQNQVILFDSKPESK